MASEKLLFCSAVRLEELKLPAIFLSLARFDWLWEVVLGTLLMEGPPHTSQYLLLVTKCYDLLCILSISFLSVSSTFLLTTPPVYLSKPKLIRL
jgi:hypothetical protein